MMEGKDIDIPTEDGPSVIGFFATRVVHANNLDEAVEKVTSMITKEWAIGTYAATNRGAAPVLSLNKTWPDTMLGKLLFKNSGHVFFTEMGNEGEA